MLKAAASIIWHDGPQACTVDEVARRSGVAKTTIYRHFGTSDALVLAVLDSDVKDLAASDTGTLRGDLGEIIDRYLNTAELPASRRMFAWVLTRSMSDPEFATMFRSVRVQPRGPTVVAIQRAIARGELPPDVDVDLVMHYIQGPFTSKRFIANEPLSVGDKERLLDMIVAGMAV